MRLHLTERLGISYGNQGYGNRLTIELGKYYGASFGRHSENGRAWLFATVWYYGGPNRLAYCHPSVRFI